MIRPLGNIVLLKRVERASKIQLIEDAKKENYDVFVEAIGDEVKKLVKIGDQVALAPHALVMQLPGKENEAYGMVAEQDIWAVLALDKAPVAEAAPAIPYKHDGD